MYEDKYLNLYFNKIVSAQNVTLNGQPLTFWYDSSSYSIILIRETTMEYQDGTGEGIVLSDGKNILEINQHVKDIQGNSLNNNFNLSIHKSSSPIISIIPNPYFYQPDTTGIILTRRIFIASLPQECEIIIKNQMQDTLQIINHSEGEFENWDWTNAIPKNESNEYKSDIYFLEIYADKTSNFKGVLIFNSE